MHWACFLGGRDMGEMLLVQVAQYSVDYFAFYLDGQRRTFPSTDPEDWSIRLPRHAVLDRNDKGEYRLVAWLTDGMEVSGG